MLRIYTKENKLNDDYYELTYKEFDSNGDLHQIGTEDFTVERIRKHTEYIKVCTWNGTKRNKGGYKWWDYERCYKIRINERKDFKAFLKKEYPNAVEIRIEKLW